MPILDMPPAQVIVIETSHSCPDSDSPRNCFPDDRVGFIVTVNGVTYVLR